MKENEKNTVENLDPSIHGALLRLLQNPKGKPDVTATEKERSNLYREAVDRIAKEWASDTDDRLQKDYPTHYHKLLDADKELNQVWLICRKEDASLDDFQKVLANWETLHKQGMELVKTQKEK